MKIFLVGGAVRDDLLGFEVKEKDWVVVGSNKQEMINLGYKQVGGDFPVFLHPDTKEEYADPRNFVSSLSISKFILQWVHLMIPFGRGLFLWFGWIDWWWALYLWFLWH